MLLDRMSDIQHTGPSKPAGLGESAEGLLVNRRSFGIRNFLNI